MNLEKILKKHDMWLEGKEGGERANLSDANLRWADLSYTDLQDVYLSDANLSDANLRWVNLRNADLTNADLRDANLRGADLRGANLRNADLRNADLTNANLSDADLTSADLKWANLRNANLSDADLTGIKTNMYTIGYNLVCPEEGSFIGYKKASRYIVKLLILEDAKRSSATTMKCRCSKAKVLEIENIKTGLKVMEVSSNYNSDFIYRVGKIVSVDNFDENRWRECAPGIHFFMNKGNALNY